MSQLDTLRGNAGTVASLKAALAAGRLPHALLLAAPNGCGRGYAARCLAADYLFPAGGPGVSGVMEGKSAELIVVEGEGKSGNIPVDRIREVRAGIFHSALSAAGRVVWIRDAHRMAGPAANALLKVLEEPPADALFILTTHDATALPATITSRCALYPLSPVGAAEYADVLAQSQPEGMDTELPGLLATVYGGRIGLGLAALQNPARLAVLQHALALGTAAAKGDRYAMLSIFSAYEGRADGAREEREALLADFSGVLAASLRTDAHPGLPAVAPDTAARLLPFVNGARSALSRNAAAKLCFAALAVKLTPQST